MCVLVTVGYCLPPPSLWPVGVRLVVLSLQKSQSGGFRGLSDLLGGGLGWAVIRVLGWRIPWLSEAWGVAGGGTGRGVDGRGEGEGRARVVGGEAA